MAYVLTRNRDGYYVARPGSARSYTRNIEDARAFDTREAAERDRCGNETLHELRYIGAFRVL